MNEATRITKGGCLCGAIRYQTLGQPEGSGYCHCRSCRRHTGAPIVAYVVFRADQVEWLNRAPERFASSKGINRAFCADCGTPLTWEGSYDGKDLIEFHISTLDHPEQFPPNEHTHYGERITWLETDDDLPKFHASFE